MKGIRWVMMSVLALTTACQRGGGGGGLVARAAGHDLTVAAVTTLLAPQAMLPDQPEVVMALADLWIDYTLLAEAARDHPRFRAPRRANHPLPRSFPRPPTGDRHHTDPRRVG